MFSSAESVKVPSRVLVLVLVASFAFFWTVPTGAGQGRPMTFMDIIDMESIGDAAVSPNKDLMLYTRSATDWDSAKDFTDVYVVSVEEGIASTRQMTFTKDKNETMPQWSADGRFFVFSSNREAPSDAESENQLYMMRPDGGEARRLTGAEGGVGQFAFSRDGQWLAYTVGKDDERNVWVISLDVIDETEPVQLIDHDRPIVWWAFAPDSERIYFIAPGRVDEDNRRRMEEGFDVMVRNEDIPLAQLWTFSMDSEESTQLTPDNDYAVSDVAISRDSNWIGFRGTPSDRYMRTVTERNIYADLYLLDAANGGIERITENEEIAESPISFSQDSSMLAFSASNDFTYNRDQKMWVRAVSDRGRPVRKLGSNHDGHVRMGFWSKDGRTIYSNTGIGATVGLLAVDVASGDVSMPTDEEATLSVSYDWVSDSFLINYSDPVTPPSIYTVASIDQIGSKANWRRLTNSNPQVEGIALGETEAIQWRSTDGKMVEGVLVKPLNYEPGRRYPLIMQLHGGPASASLLNFNASHGYYSHVYAASGYVSLLPNYRGSSNYGEEFRTEIVGDYFRQGYEDIMAGVDHLIELGLADPDKLGVMGWSAGGHWSNWILTHTDRFKAISSGAGTMNWISMYAQSDVQRNRQNYFGTFPYSDFDALWDISPLKHINNAKTPTLIHVVHDDPRVPRPQSEELHMALKKLGVPTEFFVYPGDTHGIRSHRNRMVKMVSEFNWFEKWINGKDGWFEWEELLNTLPAEEEAAEEPSTSQTDGD